MERQFASEGARWRNRQPGERGLHELQVGGRVNSALCRSKGGVIAFQSFHRIAYVKKGHPREYSGAGISTPARRKTGWCGQMGLNDAEAFVPSATPWCRWPHGDLGTWQTPFLLLASDEGPLYHRHPAGG